MNNPFSKEKGLEILEQGAAVVKQQATTTGKVVVGQVTGKQPSAPQPQGTSEAGSAPQQQALQDVVAQKQQEQFVKDLYGTSSIPQQGQSAHAQRTLDPQSVATMTAEDQKKHAEIRKHLENYYKPEYEQKPEQMRQQAEAQEKQEEQVEEQQKMEELQIKEQKDDDIALKRSQNKAEIRGGGG